MIFNKKKKLDKELIFSHVVEIVNELDQYASDGDDLSFEMVKYGLSDLKYLLGSIYRYDEIESGEVKFDMFPVNPIGVIDQVVSKFNNKKSGVEVFFRHTVNDVRINIDEKVLKEVIYNLVDNAVKYTPKGKVKVNVEIENPYLIIKIQDTGVGIDMKEKDNVFNMGYRVDNVATSETKGFGLGLWITRELVEKMGGDISLESIKGVGTEFILKFKVI